MVALHAKEKQASDSDNRSNMADAMKSEYNLPPQTRVKSENSSKQLDADHFEKEMMKEEERINFLSIIHNNRMDIIQRKNNKKFSSFNVDSKAECNEETEPKCEVANNEQSPNIESLMQKSSRSQISLSSEDAKEEDSIIEEEEFSSESDTLS